MEEVKTPRIKTTKEKTGRYWFRCNSLEQVYIHGHMNKNDVAEYFRGCMTNLFKAIEKKEKAKKRRQKSQKQKAG